MGGAVCGDWVQAAISKDKKRGVTRSQGAGREVVETVVSGNRQLIVTMSGEHVDLLDA